MQIYLVWTLDYQPWLTSDQYCNCYQYDECEACLDRRGGPTLQMVTADRAVAKSCQRHWRARIRHARGASYYDTRYCREEHCWVEQRTV